MEKSKIKTHSALIRIVNQLRREGKKIVTFSGSFDILHVGHVRALREAKAQGDILIVLLNSDASVKSYKGSTRPMNSQKHRAEVLAALKYVDYLTVFDEITPKKVLEKIKPDIHCNGPDWGYYCVERDTVEKNGGRIYIIKWTQGQSTSQILEKIFTSIRNPSNRAVFLDRDGTINDNRSGYIYQKENFRFMPHAVSALRKLTKTDYKIVIVTNQSGIGRGYYTKQDLEKLHNWLSKEFSKLGVRVDKMYYCPHLPTSGCKCRKPGIKLLLQAQKDFDLDLSKSWIVGDDEADILAGREANIKTILLKQGRKLAGQNNIRPHYHVQNLKEATKVILTQS